MQQEQFQTETAFDLEGEDLVSLVDQTQVMWHQARDEMYPIHIEADKAEEKYNLKPYADEQLPFLNSLSIRTPVMVSKIDRVASALAGAFDKEGNPIFAALPQSAETHECAAHAEKYFHQLLTDADAMTQYRLAIKRALKVGISFLSTEVVSRDVSRTARLLGFEAEYENILSVRAVKLQNMYISPVTAPEIKRCALVAERFMMSRFEFDQQVAAGFYQLPADHEPPFGYSDNRTGIEQERDRVYADNRTPMAGTQADTIDLVKAWVRFKPQGAIQAQLFYVVFAVNSPNIMYRVKANPYDYLDEAPYTPCVVDEGDGTMFGRSYIALLQDLSHMMDTLQMLRIDSVKRSYSSIWGVRESSPAWDLLQQRAAEREIPDSMNPEQPVKPQQAVRIAPDEVFPIEGRDDIFQIPMAQQNPNLVVNENLLEQFMSDATIPTAPLTGIRSAYEVNQASGQVSEKLKLYLKTLTSTMMRPHIEQVKAQAWQYLMPESLAIPELRFMQIGSNSAPVKITDFFLGITLLPVGTTTSADRAIKLTVTGDLMNQFIPILMQVPGIVPDPLKAIRVIMRERLQALGSSSIEEIMGLVPPTQQETAQQAEYMKALAQLGLNRTPQNAMGGDGGNGMGIDVPEVADRSGGAQTGVQENNPIGRS